MTWVQVGAASESAAWFHGWSVPAATLYFPGPVAAPTTWFLSIGFGPLHPGEAP